MVMCARRRATLAIKVAVATSLVVIAVFHHTAVPVAQPGPEKTIRFGFTAALIGDANPNDVVAATLLWAKGVISQVGFWTSAEASVFQDVNEAMTPPNNGKTDLLALTTLEYLAAERRLQVQPSMVFQQSNETMSDSVVLVRSDITSVSQLAGKRLAINLPAREWDMAGIWLDVLLMEAGLPARQTAFSTVKVVPRRSQAAMALFFKQVDVAVETRSAFETAVELNPQLGKELKILARSPPLLPGLICTRNSMEPDLRRRYIEKATHLHELPQFRQTFIVMRVTKILEWDPHFLDSARALVARRDALKKAAARR